MVCCTAPNCSNRSKQGNRMFRFPRDCRRKKIWVQNMRRGSEWKPTDSSRLCEKHFENSEFESNRDDHWKKLKPNAVPTLFNVPNPPLMLNPPPRKSKYKHYEPSIYYNEDVINNIPTSTVDELPIKLSDSLNTLKDTVDCEVEKLKRDNANFKRLLEREVNVAHSLKLDNQKSRSKLETIKKFLSENQIEMLLKGRISHWTNEAIIKGLKFRFALSVHGYEFLHHLHLQLLQFKVNNMDAMDKFCIISYDEMVISEQLDYNINTDKYVGQVTLGENESLLGQKLGALEH